MLQKGFRRRASECVSIVPVLKLYNFFFSGLHEGMRTDVAVLKRCSTYAPMLFERPLLKHIESYLSGVFLSILIHFYSHFVLQLLYFGLCFFVLF